MPVLNPQVETGDEPDGIIGYKKRKDVYGLNFSRRMLDFAQHRAKTDAAACVPERGKTEEKDGLEGWRKKLSYGPKILTGSDNSYADLSTQSPRAMPATKPRLSHPNRRCLCSRVGKWDRSIWKGVCCDSRSADWWRRCHMLIQVLGKTGRNLHVRLG